MSKPIPGVTYPTLKPFTPGTGNARDSATAAQTANDTKQNKLNHTGGTRKRGGTGKVAAPQMKLSYTPTGGPGQDPNSTMAANAKTSSQINANSQYDSYASKKGGNKYRWGCKSGGNKYRWGCKSGGNKYRWGCKSGGKKTKKTKTKSFCLF
jgi:hypothetical protein